MNTGKSTITTNTGCKYPGTPEPCEGYRELARERDSLQAKIDALMFEYCPDEMTEEQIDNWANHQVVSSFSLKPLKGIDQLREKE